MNEMDPAGEDQERRKQGLKSYLRTMLEYRIKNMEKTLSKILIQDKKELQNKMPQFLTQDDIQISYSTDGNPNTDLNTWSIPLLCFLTVYLYGQYVPSDEFYLTYDIPCIYFQIDDEPLQISLKPEYNGRIQNLFTHILCEQVKKELLKIIKENKQPLTTELTEKRVDIEKTCKDFLTDNDVELLFPTTGSPNTDLDTWNISVICFVIICVLELSLMDSRIFLALYNIWETENILSKDTYNHSLYQLIRNMENRSLSDADIEPEEQSFDTETVEISVDTKSEDESSFYTESDDESSFDTESEYSSYDTETEAKGGLDTEPKEKRSLDTKPKEKSVDAETEESSLDTVTGEKRCLDTEAKEKSCLDTETEESSLDEEKHKLVLDTAVSVIQEFLVPQPIFAEFTKEQYLTHTAVRDMEEAPTTTQKNKEILQHVRAKGKLGYKKFKEFLTNTNQNLLREYLQCVENGIETEHLAEQLRKEADARKRKEEREEALTTERILHTFEQRLALAVKKGKELKDKEDIEERLNVQGSTESNRQECCDTIKCVIDQGSAGVESEHVIAAVKQIVVLIDIKDSRATVEDNSCVNITMSCSSSKEMRRLLKTLQGEEFPKCVNNLTEAFEEKYEDSFEVKAKVVTEKIQHVHERLQHVLVCDKLCQTRCLKRTKIALELVSEILKESTE